MIGGVWAYHSSWYSQHNCRGVASAWGGGDGPERGVEDRLVSGSEGVGECSWWMSRGLPGRGGAGGAGRSTRASCGGIGALAGSTECGGEVVALQGASHSLVLGAEEGAGEYAVVSARAGESVSVD